MGHTPVRRTHRGYCSRHPPNHLQSRYRRKDLARSAVDATMTYIFIPVRTQLLHSERKQLSTQLRVWDRIASHYRVHKMWKPKAHLELYKAIVLRADLTNQGRWTISSNKKSISFCRIITWLVHRFLLHCQSIPTNEKHHTHNIRKTRDKPRIFHHLPGCKIHFLHPILSCQAPPRTSSSFLSWWPVQTRR